MTHNVKKIIRVGMGKVKSRVRTRISEVTGINVTVPAQVYWNMSNKCNFRCKMCPQWNRGMYEEEKEYCGRDEMKRIVDQMQRLGIKNLGISGGEPMLRKDLLFQVLSYANQKGIYTHFGSNGWLITEEVIKKYDAIGGGHISMSLDGIGERHDDIRGIKGAYQKVISVLEMYKKIKPKHVMLKINTVMSDRNLNQILDIVNLAERYGASIFIQPFDNFAHDIKYAHNGIIDESFKVKEKHLERVNEVVRALLLTKKERRGLILNSTRYLESIPDYFAHRFQSNRKCQVAYKNFSIDPFGNVLPCGFLGPVGNVKKNSIMEIWNNANSKESRVRMKYCKQNCMEGCFFDMSVWEMMKEGIGYLMRSMK